MTSTPWSVKGIDAKARETAKELARRSGMTLGEWLNQRIREEGGSLVEERAHSVSRALNELTGMMEQQEQRSSVSLSDVDQTVKGMLARLELTERAQTAAGARVETIVRDQGVTQSLIDERISRLELAEREHAARAGENDSRGQQAANEQQLIRAAIEERLRKLEADAAGPRSAEALKRLETAVGQVASSLQEGETRTRGELAAMRREIGATVARLQTVESDQSASHELTALAERLDRAETVAIERLRTLEKSYAEIMRRLSVTEEKADRADPSLVDKKLDAMAANMARGLQSARSEMVKQIDRALSADSERLDQSLMELTAHVQRAEKRSAQALEKMGQEVLRVADVLNRRVQGVETRAAGAIQNMGGEIARVVDSLDGRLDRADLDQAENLQKMGDEIGRVTERLSDRIATAERRAAQAVDDVQDKLALAAERLNQRHDRAQGDLAERIRQSEERTQRFLEEARERIDRRLAEAPRQPASSAPFPTPEAETNSRYAERASFADDLADAETFPSAQPESAGAAGPLIYPDAAPFGHSFTAHAFAPQGFTPVEPNFDQADLEAAQDLPSAQEPQSEADFIEDSPASAEPFTRAPEENRSFAIADRDGSLDLDAQAPTMLEHTAAPPPAPAEDIAQRTLTTRELVEQARAAARAASSENRARKFKTPGGARGASQGMVVSPIGVRGRRKDNGARTAMLVTLTGAVALVGAAAYTLLRPAGDQLVQSEDGAARTPRAAIALDPKPIIPAASAPAMATSALDPAATALYQEGLTRIKAKDNGGVEPLTRAANLGHTQAQYTLGQLYENGSSGLVKNLVEARRWYERAAQRGDPSAMHNTGLMHYEGIGGPQNLAVAADWFKRAAELGLADSQFNIGKLYESGLGVTQNSAEAYKWYLLASRQGSAAQQVQARNAAEKVKMTLPAEARATAERVANEFATRPAPIQPTVAGLDVPTVQMVLSRLGYYKGVANGVASSPLRTALLEFQRDNNIPQTGQVDAATTDKLLDYAR